VRRVTRNKNANSPKAKVANRGNARKRDLVGGIGARNTNTQTRKKASRFKPSHRTLKILNSLYKIIRNRGVTLTKQEIRMRVWQLMEEKGVAAFPKPVLNRIPNFVGAEKAAQNLRELPEYRAARVVFCNPDSPQRPVREMALRDGKTVVMATPKLRGGFLLLDPNTIPSNRIPEASTIRGAFRHGHPIEPSRVGVDFFVAGSVAVSPDGGRLGKGTGYSDQEYRILRGSGGLAPQAPVVTTVHDVQIVENIPKDQWDIPVDIISTPSRVIRTTKRLPPV